MKFLSRIVLALVLVTYGATMSWTAYNTPVACSGLPALTGDLTSSACATTLATVNSNVGSFGSATQATQLTVNGKGLVTAAANVTVTPAVGSITGLGTGIATALGVSVGTAGSPVINGGALGTPSSGVATNLTGTAAGLTAGTVTTNANLTGDITSSGNATTLATAQSAAHTWSGIQTYSSGSIQQIRVITAAGAVTVATTDYIICLNKTSGASTAINLPSTPATGTLFVIKDCKGDAATNNMTVTPAAGNIDGAGTFVMTVNYQSINVVYSGTQWNIF